MGIKRQKKRAKGKLIKRKRIGKQGNEKKKKRNLARKREKGRLTQRK